MGWGFRKSINLGPLRINASKSGIGYSIGGRGFRVGKDARGRSYRSISIPGTGIYNRTYTKKRAVSTPTTYNSSSQTSLNSPPPKKFPAQGIGKAAAYIAAGVLIYLIIYAIVHLL